MLKIMKNDYADRITKAIKKLKEDKKTALILIGAILGMVLIMFSGNSVENENKSTENNLISETMVQEEKLQKLLSEIEGAGKVKVMITYKNGGEDVFAFDKDETFRDNEQNFKSDYIIIKNSDGETGLKLKTVSPEVKGVAVVCSGASDPVTKEQIISVVSALFDISTKNISVVCAET